MNSTITACRSEKGFTLVELAIVMIIIGLLIGGLLKGQELISNARVASTVAQIKAIDAATSTFKDKFDGMPGDLASADTRLVNCAGAPCKPAALTTNGLVDNGGGFAAAPSNEALAFFPQLAAAGLMSGVNPVQGLVWGGDFPKANVGGGFHVSYMVGNATMPSPSGQVAGNISSGHYLALHNTPGAGVAATAVGSAMTPNQAFRIDNKLDDGAPGTGSVIGAGVAAGAAGCASAAGGVYVETVDTTACSLYIRFQQ